MIYGIIRVVSCVIIAGLFACSGGSSEHTTETGLIIFATSEYHNGDFANDPNLTGSNGIQKADVFCNNSSYKPNNSTYKALLVDGVTRDAVTQIDWVLKPNTTYYRFDGVTVIGTTNANSIFDVYYGSLTNSIDEYSRDYPGVWTGIDNIVNFESKGNNCGSWSSTSGYGSIGFWHTETSGAFSDQLSNCGVPQHLYCVEQL